jgi:HSP20 family molecular chaperone IbpA
MALLLHASPLLFTAPLCGRGGARSMRPQVESLEDGGVRLSLPLPGLGEGDVTVEVADAENGGGVLLIHAQPHGETELRCGRPRDSFRARAPVQPAQPR